MTAVNTAADLVLNAVVAEYPIVAALTGKGITKANQQKMGYANRDREPSLSISVGQNITMNLQHYLSYLVQASDGQSLSDGLI